MHAESWHRRVRSGETSFRDISVVTAILTSGLSTALPEATKLFEVTSTNARTLSGPNSVRSIGIAVAAREPTRLNFYLIEDRKTRNDLWVVRLSAQ
jgi:pyocin large subunit-like protein